jgi:hypothetical protein
MRTTACAILLALIAAAPAGDAPLYSNDFTKATPGKPPEADFLVLAGNFEITDVDGGRVLEVAGTPFDSFGVLFGPATPEPSCNISARVWGANTGKRVPEFGVGASDTGGYKLWLMPRHKQLVIRKGEETVATASYDNWKPGTWTCFRLDVSKSGDGAWTVRGKVWPDGSDEPKDWKVSFEEKDGPAPGRASLWANTYSGQPVRFDDLLVTK